MQTVALGNLVSIQTGKLDANASSIDGGYPFFTCAREPLRIANWKYDLDAVLVAGNGDLNVKHYSGKFDAYQRTYIITSKNVEQLDTRYLYHFMDKYLEKLREQSIGGIIKYIKLGMLTDAPIPLPPLEEQKRIAAILDQADDIRHKRQHAIDRLNQLGQAIFYDMFGDVTQTVALGNLVSIQTGKLDANASSPDGAYPFFTCAREPLRIANWKYDLDAVLVAGNGDLNVKHYNGKFDAYQRTYIITSNNLEKLDTTYLYYFMDNYLDKLRDLSIGGIIKYIKLGMLTEAKIPLPQIEGQRRFASHIRELELCRRKVEGAYSIHKTLFASLQHRAFTGQL